MDILETIVTKKRFEVAHQKKAVSLDFMLQMGSQALQRPTVSMHRALKQSDLGIIAEFKRRSPSKGWLYPEAKVTEVVSAYAQNGAAACSILTDSEFFGGSFADLRRARSIVALPLLRKDFIIDEYQLYQARVMGADAILLIAACLTKEACKRMAKIARQLELEVLLEVHQEKEMAYLNEYVDMIGVNNRHLGSFHTDIAISFQMIERLKSEVGVGESAPLFISESGITTLQTIRELREAGFRGFLMGETFMKTSRPGDALKSILNKEG